MKALTICQPYAHFIGSGEKRVENRSWPTNYRGPLAIHAGKSLAWMEGQTPPPGMVFGAVVAVAQLVDVLPIGEIWRGYHDERYPWLREHEHTNGEWCWVLEGAERLVSPVPWRGKQGLWEIDDSALPRDGHDKRPPKSIDNIG